MSDVKEKTDNVTESTAVAAPIPTEVQLLAGLNQSNVEEKQGSSLLAEIATLTYIPALNVCYGVSEIVKQRLAQGGDFSLGGKTNLGQTIKIVLLGYRLKATIWNKAKEEFEGTIYHMVNNPKTLAQDEEWQNFLKKERTLTMDQKLEKGTELFVYLPESNNFGLFFMKNTLEQFAQPIWQCKVGRLVQLTTALHKGKRNDWYDLVIVPLAKSLRGVNINIPGQTIEADISMPMDLYARNLELFQNPRKFEKLEDAPAAPARNR